MVLLPALIATRAVLNRIRASNVGGRLNTFVAVGGSGGNSSSTLLSNRLLSADERSALLRSRRCKDHDSRRNCASESSKHKDDKVATTDDSEWKLVYRFDKILAVRFFTRFVLLVAAVTVLNFVWIAVQSGAVTWMTFFAPVNFLFLLLLYRRFALRIVGVLSVHEDKTKIRVGHLSFWGSRRNAFIPVDSIVPFSELPVSPQDSFVPLRRYDSRDVFYMPIRGSTFTIHDQQAFVEIFGGNIARDYSARQSEAKKTK